MKWLIAAILLLFVALALNLMLLVYAMYAMIGIILVSQWVTSRWAQAMNAERTCDIEMAEIGDVVPVMVKLEHAGRFPIAWLLVEDMLEQKSLSFQPPSLDVKGKRLEVMKLNPGDKKQLFYQLQCNRCLLYTSPSPRDQRGSRMPSSA